MMKRIVLAVLLAAAVSFCLLPMTSQAGAAQAGVAAGSGSCSHQVDTAAPPISPGAQCIPCSPKKPCTNPLTVCTYSGSATHGCCLGYAGEN